MEEYRCLICPKFGMFSEVEMKNHGEDFHNDLRSICRVCLNRFPTDKQLGVHRTSCKAPPPPLTYRSSVVFQDLALKHTDNSWQSVSNVTLTLTLAICLYRNWLICSVALFFTCIRLDLLLNPLRLGMQKQLMNILFTLMLNV